MFFRRKRARVTASQSAFKSAVRSTSFIETLEQRQLLSATVLSPAAVEGDYKGSVVTSSGESVPVKVIVTKTKADLIVNGSVTLSESLTSAHLVALRHGTFDVTFKLSGESVTCTGKELSGGKKISGKYTTSAKKNGTFSLTKI